MEIHLNEEDMEDILAMLEALARPKGEAMSLEEYESSETRKRDQA